MLTGAGQGRGATRCFLGLRDFACVQQANWTCASFARLRIGGPSLVATVVKAHSPIAIETLPRHPESAGGVEHFSCAVRDETDNDYGERYLMVEAIIARLMQHYNEERQHAALDYITPATWHREQPEQVQKSACRANRCSPSNTEYELSGATLAGRLSGASLHFQPKCLAQVGKKRDAGLMGYAQLRSADGRGCSVSARAQISTT